MESTGARLGVHQEDGQVVVVLTTEDDDGGAGGVELLRYVLDDPSDPWESPTPHLHPLRTTGGAVVTDHRPDDHRWHKGLAVTLTHVTPQRGAPQNFWGGNTYVPGRGYLPLEEVGSVRHLGFEHAAVTADEQRVELDQRLQWLTHDGAEWFSERRSLVVHSAHPGASDQPGTWALDLVSDLVNTSGQELRVGSPTTLGRPAAGYCGLFWRGPLSWTGGPVLSPAGEVAEDVAMGSPSETTPWLALSGPCDGVDGEESSGGTVALVADLFTDVPGRSGARTDWFVRSAEFPGIAPSPAFSTEVVLSPGGHLLLAHRVLVADAQLTAEQVADALAALPGTP